MNSLSDSLRDSNEKIENEQRKREADNLYLNVRVWSFFKHYFKHYGFNGFRKKT